MSLALERSTLRGKRVAVITFSPYAKDPRPRRAAEALVTLGMAVDVLCITEDDQDPKRETLNGVHIRRIPVRRHRGSKLTYVAQYGAFILVTFLILARRSLTRPYDLVHVHNMPDLLVLSALGPKVLGAKIILDLHDPMPELMMTIFGLGKRARSVRLLERLEKSSIAIADLVITVNLACKKLFASRSCRPEKIEVIMNSPDDKVIPFRPVGPPAAPARSWSKPFVIMYHGSCVERNGLNLAVDAVARVRASIPTAELRVWGYPTPFLDLVMGSVRARGLDGVVRYRGSRRIEELADAIDECDVGLIPNQRSVFTEINTPTRIFEYLARAKPVIAPRVGGIQDYFDDQSLVLFELGSADDLARKIEYVFRHPKEITEIVKRGQEVYLAHTWRQEERCLVTRVTDLLDTKN